MMTSESVMVTDSVFESSDNFGGRISDSGKDGCLNVWLGKESRHSSRAEAIGGMGDDCITRSERPALIRADGCTKTG